MSGSQTNEVATFSHDLGGCISVRVSHPCSADKMKAAIGEHLGLKPTSLTLFGLFEGSLGSQTSVLHSQQMVSPSAKLCFQRWNMDVALETRLCRHDDVATNLLFAEAQFNIEHGIITISTDDEREELASLADPSFPAERQYLELARTLPGYNAHIARGVTVENDIVTNNTLIASGTVITCRLDQHMMSMEVGNEGNMLSWRWQLVKRWRTMSANQLHYEVCILQGNAPILTWIHLKTSQAYYLRAVSELVCHSLHHPSHHHQRGHGQRQQSSLPVADPKMAGRPFNPLTEFLNTELFRVDKFSSVENDH